MLCSKENGIHGKTLAKLHITKAVAHHHTTLKIYTGKIFLGLHSHAGIRFAVAVFINYRGSRIYFIYPAAICNNAVRILLFISRSDSIVIIPRPTPR